MFHPPTSPRGVLLLILIVTLGLVGIFLVMLLGTMWRRFNARQGAPPAHTPMPDIWQAAGTRIDPDSVFPPEPPEPPDTPDPDDSKDDDDDDSPHAGPG
jgi:hypothetical protein